MKREHINSWTPPDIAERAADRGVKEYSAEDLKEAREELKEKLLAGDRVGRVDLEALLDQELNDHYKGALRTLYEKFAGIEYGDHYLICSDISEWMRRLVNEHLDANPDVIEERAAEIAAERDA